MKFYFRINNTSIEWRIHALQQMSARNISREDVLEIISSGEIVESYPDDSLYPSYLLLGYVKERPIHVVIAHAESLDVVYIVTAYEPDKMKWDEDFRRRR